MIVWPVALFALITAGLIKLQSEMNNPAAQDGWIKDMRDWLEDIDDSLANIREFFGINTPNKLPETFGPQIPIGLRPVDGGWMDQANNYTSGTDYTKDAQKTLSGAGKTQREYTTSGAGGIFSNKNEVSMKIEVSDDRVKVVKVDKTNKVSLDAFSVGYLGIPLAYP
jgi:hypothetical protein